MSFEESFDDDLRRAMALGDRDRAELWPKVRQGASDRWTLWDLLAPMATAAAVLAVAWSITRPSGKVAWPINDTVKDVPMAGVSAPSSRTVTE